MATLVAGVDADFEHVGHGNSHGHGNGSGWGWVGVGQVQFDGEGRGGRGNSPWLKLGHTRPTPVPVEGRWIVDAAPDAVADTLRGWVRTQRGEVVRPPADGVVAQIGAALLYRAASKWGPPRWDKVPVRLTVHVSASGAEGSTIDVHAIANPGPMMPDWSFPYPKDHYARRPRDLVDRLVADLSAHFAVRPDATP